MPDAHSDGPILPLTAADITDEIWQEVARHHSDAAPLRLAAERARRASSPAAVPTPLPAPLPLSALLALDGTGFIDAAYATVLNRAADPAGIAFVQAEMAAGRSKLELLGELQRSAEGRALGRELPGLGRRYLVRRLYRLPVAGPALRLAGSVLRRLGVARAFAARERLDVAVRAEVESRLTGFEAAMDSRRRALEERLAEQQTAVELATRRLAAVQAAQDELSRRCLAAIADQGRALSTLSDRADGFVRQVADLEDSVIESLLSLHQRATDHAARLAMLEGGTDAAAARRQIEAAAGQLRVDLDDRLAAADGQMAQVRQSAAEQQRRVGLVLHALQNQAPAAARAVDDDMLDDLYIAFADRVRGPEAAIKERLRVHLPRLHDVGAGTPERPILDIGAGRGEFLELLREERLAAFGVDTSETMAASCRAKGLDCTQAEALAFLAAQAGGSLGAVTLFHVAERLPLKGLMRIMDEALRALAPGGLLLLETPNPANLLTSTRTYYMDPTHCRPLPAELLAMAAQARGFQDLDIVELHPMSERFPGADRPLAEALDRLFHGPQDYALVARKAR